MRSFFGFLAVIVISGCATSTVTPISKNEFLLNTSAEPVCGQTGTAKVAGKMAAVETIKAGYDGFTIFGVRSGNNVQVVQTPPTGAITNSTFTGYGNAVYGQSDTTFYGGGPILLGEYNQDLAVRMFKRGEPGFDNAVDARKFLGEEWQTIVTNGVMMCT